MPARDWDEVGGKLALGRLQCRLFAQGSQFAAALIARKHAGQHAVHDEVGIAPDR